MSPTPYLEKRSGCDGCVERSIAIRHGLGSPAWWVCLTTHAEAAPPLAAVGWPHCGLLVDTPVHELRAGGYAQEDTPVAELKALP